MNSNIYEKAQMEIQFTTTYFRQKSEIQSAQCIDETNDRMTNDWRYVL